MPSTFTDSLRLEEQGIGENSNTWGDKLNSTIDLIDKSIAGHVSVATAGGVTQLTTVNNGEDQARYRIIEITGTLGSNVILEVPAVSKEYIVWDSTTRGGFTISFRIGAAGSTIAVPISTTRAFGISTDGTDWRPLSADLASETAPGIVEISSTAEAQAGASNSVVLTPLRLQDVTATTTRSGVVELATQTEVNTGTDTSRGIVPATLKAYADTRLGTSANLAAANTTTLGLVELATNTEAAAGSAADKALVPANLASATQALDSATTSAKGTIELATQTEVDTGTDTVRAVVPSTLKSYVTTRIGGVGNLSLASDIRDGSFNPGSTTSVWTGPASATDPNSWTDDGTGFYIFNWGNFSSAESGETLIFRDGATAFDAEVCAAFIYPHIYMLSEFAGAYSMDKIDITDGTSTTVDIQSVRKV